MGDASADLGVATLTLPPFTDNFMITSKSCASCFAFSTVDRPHLKHLEEPGVFSSDFRRQIVTKALPAKPVEFCSAEGSFDSTRLKVDLPDLEPYELSPSFVAGGDQSTTRCGFGEASLQHVDSGASSSSPLPSFEGSPTHDSLSHEPQRKLSPSRSEVVSSTSRAFSGSPSSSDIACPGKPAPPSDCFERVLGIASGMLTPLLEESMGNSQKQGRVSPEVDANQVVGKEVQVFWPGEDMYYTATVKEFDSVKNELFLVYEDGTLEWMPLGAEGAEVKIEGGVNGLFGNARATDSKEGADAPTEELLPTPVAANGALDNGLHELATASPSELGGSCRSCPMMAFESATGGVEEGAAPQGSSGDGHELKEVDLAPKGPGTGTPAGLDTDKVGSTNVKGVDYILGGTSAGKQEGQGFSKVPGSQAGHVVTERWRSLEESHGPDAEHCNGNGQGAEPSIHEDGIATAHGDGEVFRGEHVDGQQPGATACSVGVKEERSEGQGPDLWGAQQASAGGFQAPRPENSSRASVSAGLNILRLRRCGDVPGWAVAGSSPIQPGMNFVGDGSHRSVLTLPDEPWGDQALEVLERGEEEHGVKLEDGCMEEGRSASDLPQLGALKTVRGQRSGEADHVHRKAGDIEQFSQQVVEKKQKSNGPRSTATARISKVLERARLSTRKQALWEGDEGDGGPTRTRRITDDGAGLTPRLRRGAEDFLSPRGRKGGAVETCLSMDIYDGDSNLSGPCLVNVLILSDDYCIRERDAVVDMRPEDGGGFMLVVSRAEEVLVSHRAEQFGNLSATTNKHTHALMWRLEKGQADKSWMLEFEDRKHWQLFKELHEECCSRNRMAARERNIPIPGVHEVPGYEAIISRKPFEQGNKYIRAMEGDEAAATFTNRILYDLDSDDEEWLEVLNSKCDQAGNPTPVAAESRQGDDLERREMEKHAGVSDRLDGQKLSSRRVPRRRASWVKGLEIPACSVVVTDEELERVVDRLEKSAAQRQGHLLPLEAAVEECNDLVVKDAVHAIHAYWLAKRRWKRGALVRYFQPPAWQRYQQDLQEWQDREQVRLIRAGGSSPGPGPKKPPLFAFCLRPEKKDQKKLQKHKSKRAAHGHEKSHGDGHRGADFTAGRKPGLRKMLRSKSVPLSSVPASPSPASNLPALGASQSLISPRPSRRATAPGPSGLQEGGEAPVAGPSPATALVTPSPPPPLSLPCPEPEVVVAEGKAALASAPAKVKAGRVLRGMKQRSLLTRPGKRRWVDSGMREARVSESKEAVPGVQPGGEKGEVASSIEPEARDDAVQNDGVVLVEEVKRNPEPSTQPRHAVKKSHKKARIGGPNVPDSERKSSLRGSTRKVGGEAPSEETGHAQEEVDDERDTRRRLAAVEATAKAARLAAERAREKREHANRLMVLADEALLKAAKAVADLEALQASIAAAETKRLTKAHLQGASSLGLGSTPPVQAMDGMGRWGMGPPNGMADWSARSSDENRPLKKKQRLLGKPRLDSSMLNGWRRDSGLIDESSRGKGGSWGEHGVPILGLFDSPDDGTQALLPAVSPIAAGADPMTLGNGAMPWQGPWSVLVEQSNGGMVGPSQSAAPGGILLTGGGSSPVFVHDQLSMSYMKGHGAQFVAATMPVTELGGPAGK